VIEESSLNRLSLADSANERANLYSLLMRGFGDLPDDILLTEVRSPVFKILFDRLCQRFTKLKAGANCFQSFLSDFKNVNNAEIVPELSADRIRIINGLNGLTLNLQPDLLGNKENKHSAILNVTYFRLDEKELPDESVSSLLDYLCTELDYMNYLCHQEQSQWTSQINALKTVSQEADFLRDNLNGWTGVFCAEGIKHSSTSFYRGFLSTLENFVPEDLEYLNNLMLTMK
jgi:hypothetical protein